MITLVQISDVHFKNDHTNIERLEKLSADIQRNLPPDDRAFLLLSGDIANAGDASQYDSFLEHFIFPTLELFEGTVICPGNHDIQRAFNNEKIMDEISGDIDRPYLYDENGKLSLECPLPVSNLSNYESFQSLTTSPIASNFFGSRHEFPELSVVSLNTAWLSRKRTLPDTDRGKLRIDIPAINSLTKSIDNKKMRVALMHHPLDWISEDSRQEVEDALTSQFDIVLSGHVHSQSAVSGKFNGGNCVLHQAPTVRSKESRGANAYSLIRVAVPDKRYRIMYRSYAIPQAKFIAGTELRPNGVLYPSENDESFWSHLKSTAPGEIIQEFSSKLPQVDFSDWASKNTPSKTRTPLKAVEPKFSKIQFSDGEKQPSQRTGLYQALKNLPNQSFFIGPSDSGLSTSAYLALKHISLNAVSYDAVPAYVNVLNIAVNKASLISEAAKANLAGLTHKQFEALAESGSLVFLIDGICMPDTEKFNHVRDTLDKYFPKCRSVFFCSLDGNASEISNQIEVRLDPTTDVIYEVEQLSASCIRELVGLHLPEKDDAGRQVVIDNIIHSFKSMDEPIYASCAVLLIDTLRQIPEYQPINRVRLLDRYVEVLLGRFDVEDVRTGSFSSTDKLALISYLAGHFIESGTQSLPMQEWNGFVSKYSSDKLLAVPNGIIDEFTSKGILINKSGNITFRADYLFSYFSAREMHQSPKLRDFILDGDNFFSHHREIAAYGELEGVNNGELIESVKARLDTLEEKVIEQYTRRKIDLDFEMQALLNGDAGEEKMLDLANSASELSELPNRSSPDDRHLDGELRSVDRARGVTPRSEIRHLESRWLNTLLTYFKLLKHSENLSGSDKIRHVEAALEGGELFVKSLASKRNIIARSPAVVLDGILYLNPMASTDKEKSIAEFKYAAPMSVGRIMKETLSNPKLSPVFRVLSTGGSETRNYFIRRLLLDHSSAENSETYLKSILKSPDITLTTCSLRELKMDFVTQAHSGPRRKFIQGIVDQISSSNKFSHIISKKTLEKRRVMQMLKAAANRKRE